MQSLLCIRFLTQTENKVKINKAKKEYHQSMMTKS